MTEKTLIKIDWKDIVKYFPNAERCAILQDTAQPRILIPTTSFLHYFSYIQNCITEWKANNVKIRATLNGLLEFEIIWDENFSVEVEV